MPSTTPNFALPYPLASEPPDGPAQIGALATRLDAVLETVNTRTSVGGNNGGGVRTIANGNAWANTPDAVVNVPVTGPGLLLVYGVVTMNDPGDKPGDAEAKVVIGGPVGTVITNVARVGISAGDGAVTATVPVQAVVPVTGSGTVSITRQVRHNIASGTGATYYSFDISWVLVKEQ